MEKKDKFAMPEPATPKFGRGSFTRGLLDEEVIPENKVTEKPIYNKEETPSNKPEEKKTEETASTDQESKEPAKKRSPKRPEKVESKAEADFSDFMDMIAESVNKPKRSGSIMERDPNAKAAYTLYLSNRNMQNVIRVIEKSFKAKGIDVSKLEEEKYKNLRSKLVDNILTMYFGE